MQGKNCPPPSPPWLFPPRPQSSPPASQAGAARTKLTGTVLENMVHAYTTMNTFLIR